MKNIIFLAIILCFTSCMENKKPQTKDTRVNLHKPNVDFNSLQIDFRKWWTYHYNNISLSSEFIALNDRSEIISKKFFLEKLLTGDYIPLKLETSHSVEKLKLFKLDSSADQSIRTTIKSTSTVIYEYFKKEGSNFPEFNFKDLNGKEYKNENTFGKTLIIKCWFINCKPCIAEFPELNELVERHNDREDILFISLAIDSKADLEKFLNRKTFKYETIPNQEEFMNITLDVKQYPTHIVVNKNGIVEKVVSKSSELISYLKKSQITVMEETKNLPPPPPPESSK